MGTHSDYFINHNLKYSKGGLMANYEIYCPCMVEKIGFGKVNGDIAYLLWGWIKDKDERAKCKFCGEIVKIKGGEK